MKEKFNIQIEETKPDADPDQMLNTMIASGNLPDAMFLDRRDSFFSLIDRELLVPMDDWIDKYPGAKEAILPATLELLRVDGSIYGLPQWVRKDPTGGNLGFVYSKKAYEAAGSPELKTMDEVYDFLLQVKDSYTQANGQNVTPMATESYQNLLDLIHRTFGGFTVAEQLITVVDGKVTWKYEDPKFREAALYFNRMWNDGLLAQDLFSQTPEQISEKLTAGAVGLFGGYWIPNLGPQGINFRQLLVETDPDDDYIPIDYPLAEGVSINQFYGENAGTTGGSNTVITTSADQPERIYELFSYLLTQEGSRLQIYGPQGNLWEETTDEGYPVLTKYPSSLSTEETNALGLWKWMTPASADNIDKMKFYVNENAPEEEKDCTITLQADVYTPRMWITDEFFGMESMIDPDSAEGIAQSTIRDYLIQEEPRMLSAGSPEEAEAILNDIIEYGNSQGMGDILEIYNQKWEENKQLMGTSHLKN